MLINNKYLKYRNLENMRNFFRFEYIQIINAIKANEDFYLIKNKKYKITKYHHFIVNNKFIFYFLLMLVIDFCSDENNFLISLTMAILYVFILGFINKIIWIVLRKKYNQ